jgi:para-aminobenzoate synthetase/4-amino-4-deoxychorismate lyase
VVGKSGGFAAERLCQAKVGVAAVWQATEQAMEKAMSDRSKDGGAARGGERDAFVLLDDSLSRTDRCWLFERPMEVVRCDRPEDVEAALLRLAAAGANGLFGAGFLSYELGYLMEPKLAPLLPQDRLQPLLWFGLFDAPRELDSAAVGRWLETRIFGDYELGGLHWSLSQEDYLTAARRVKDYIAAGDVYQINLTLKGLFDFAGDPLALYRDLRRRQRVAHGALVVAPDFQVLSLSPELFLRVENGMAEARPMKGTAARGASPEEDAALGEWLSSDVKSRAENLMIVDLLRNDLGRVAEIGSVEVTDLFTVESYPTLHQMTSGITARLRPDVGLPDIARGLFPCGSITGAPKLRAMEIIRELEPAPRGVYTGAIGMLAPGGDALFNVAIRTVFLDGRGGGQLGIGSGIVQDSDPLVEWEECLLKARFLTADRVPFQLIETLRWERKDGYYLLERHLDRLSASAAYFGYPCDAEVVRGQLAREAQKFAAAPVMRVRLLLDEDGAVSLEAGPMELLGDEHVLTFVISDERVQSGDPFTYHKTTRRELYDREFERHQKASGCGEVVFLNERGEVTEGSRTNLFIERAGVLMTPPPRCGLLAGTLRGDMIDNPNLHVEERVLSLADLEAADRIYLGNSVRGLMHARRLA